MASSDSEEFELVDSVDVAKLIVLDKKPDLAKITSWLVPTDYAASSSEFRRHLSSRAAGTGEWIRQTSQFQQWHSSQDHGSLWIKAVPGAGKSVVAASMADSLSRNEGVPVLYFFFRQIIEANQNSGSLLRDWLTQLLPASEVLQVFLWDLVEAKATLQSVSTDQLWEMLLSALRGVGKAYCIVDALDEMDFDEDFLARLNDLGRFLPERVKVLLTSRPKQYLQRAMKDPQVIHVSLEEELVKLDISVFVQQRVSLMTSLSMLSRNSIQATVCDRSQGLFLYARLMLDQIAQSLKEDQLNESAICQMVAKLPIGLEEMYNRLLFEHAKISNVKQAVQVLILQLVTQSARPLRLIEVAQAIEASHCGMDRNCKDIARTACGPLLEIMEDEVIQILHHSFTEFLLDEGRLHASPPQFPVIDPSTAHRNIATICLNYLQGNALEDYSNGTKADATLHKVRGGLPGGYRGACIQYPLLAYATKNWTYHARHFQGDEPDFFESLTAFCNTQKPQFRAWLSYESEVKHQGYDEEAVEGVRPPRTTPLHIAAGYGLLAWSKYLMQHGMDVNVTDCGKVTPIFWASRFGHAQLVSILLEAGASPDLDGWDGSKPLHMAALNNHPAVVKALVAAGVSPLTPKTRDVGRMCGNAPTSVGHSPLRYASMAGHTDCILEMIPSVVEASDLEDALCWAAQGGHSQAVGTLLDNSTVSPDARLKVRHESVSVTTGGKTALMLATRSLNHKTVRILLDKGADATKTCSQASTNPPFTNQRFSTETHELGAPTALHSFAGCRATKESEGAAKQIVSMLLTSGADLEARDADGNTPLLLTMTTSGRYNQDATLALMSILIAAGADFFAADNNGETLLHKACATACDINSVKKIIELGGNHSQPRHSDGATPLHLAAARYSDTKELIELLIEHGANVNERDAEGNTPLLCALKRGLFLPETIDAFLDAKADLNLQNKLGQACLHFSSFSHGADDQRWDQFKRLIDSGANIELCDQEGKTALLHAIAATDELKTKVLLDRTSPLLTARTYREGKSCLHLACLSRDPFKMIPPLIDHGADPTWVDNQGNTLLHDVAAGFRGDANDIALVRKLIEIGVPIRTLNCRRRAAWHVVHQAGSNNNHQSKSASRQSLFSLLRDHDPMIDVDSQDIDGYAPLHLAAATSEAQTFGLLQAGASVSIKALDLRTPLHCAARARKSGVLAMLLDRASKVLSSDQMALLVNSEDKHHQTPLHDACRSGRPESVRMLLDYGARADRSDFGPFNLFGMTKSLLRACLELVEENEVWSCLRRGSVPFDEFRPGAASNSRPDHDDQQHDTARKDPILSMLLEAGARDPFAFPLTVQAEDSTLVAASKEKAQSGLPVVPNLPGRSNEAKVGHRHQPKATGQCLSATDEAKLDEMSSSDIDLGKSAAYHALLGVLADKGLVEKMSKVVDKVKMVGNYLTGTQTGTFRPVLHNACNRLVYNVGMLRLLITTGNVDVNAHEWVKEKDGYRETGNYVSGPTALHVLARGKQWWHVEAINFLIQNGKLLSSHIVARG